MTVSQITVPLLRIGLYGAQHQIWQEASCVDTPMAGLRYLEYFLTYTQINALTSFVLDVLRRHKRG